MDRNPNETARKTAEDALSRLVSELRAGRSEALTNYLAAMSRLRRQSWSNVLLITAQRPDATHVSGFHGWNDLGRAVKKGEKGILVFAPGSPKQEYPFRPAGVRTTYVFDVSQTEGRPFAGIAQTKNTDAWEYGEQLRALVTRRTIDLQVDRSIEPARGISSGRKIRLKPGLSPAQHFSVLTHELAHEMLHHRPEAEVLSRHAIEAQAAGIAYVVARGLGIETHTATAEYMAEFSGAKRAFAQTLAVIQETSAKILDELLPEARAAAEGVASSAPQQRLPLDEEAFDKLHREYGDRLIHSLTGFVRDRTKAEDLAARAFQTAWEKRETFRGESLPTTWLESIARNQARESLSRDRTLRFDSTDGEEARELAAPELVTDELEKRDDRLRLQNALVQVPIKHRRALIDHFVDGLSTREIARRERVPLGTVLSRIFTGKQLLRQAWESPPATQTEVTTRQNQLPRRLERQGSQASEPSGYRQPESPELTWDR